MLVRSARVYPRRVDPMWGRRVSRHGPRECPWREDRKHESGHRRPRAQLRHRADDGGSKEAMPPEGSAWLPSGKCSVRRAVIPELLHELWRKYFDLGLVRLLLAEQHQLDHTARRVYRVCREGVEALIGHVIALALNGLSIGSLEPIGEPVCPSNQLIPETPRSPAGGCYSHGSLGETRPPCAGVSCDWTAEPGGRDRAARNPGWSGPPSAGRRTW